MIGWVGLPLVAVLAAPAAAGAGDPARAIAAATAQVAEAGVTLEAARAGGPGPVAVLATAVEAYEAALSALRSGVGEAEARERAVTLGLGTRRDEVARLLATLAAISRAPPPEAALHPQGPTAGARSAAIVARMTPALRQQADRLADALAEVAAVRALGDRGTAALQAGLATLAAAQAELVAAMAEAAPMSGDAVSPALTTMARDSETLSALAAALAETPDAPPDADLAADEAADGTARPMPWPVRGEVLRRFDEPDAAGARRPGLVLRAPPLSLVRAPVTATVRYAGPFLEYGYVLVLEPAPATMVVLAGLAQLQVETGAVVRRGDLLGLLGGRPLDVEEYVMLPQADTGAGGGETLYIEIRQGRGPVDPEPLFAAKG